MMVNDSDHQFLAVALAVGFASLSFLASCLTLYLIKRLAKWNGYIQLVVSLTVCQIIYDLSFFFLPLSSYGGPYCYVFLNTFGGLSSSLWSNVIIIVTARIVIRLRTVDTLKQYRRYFVVVMIPSSTVALGTVVFFNNETYENYAIICYFAIRISLMHDQPTSSSHSKTSDGAVVAAASGNGDEQPLQSSSSGHSYSHAHSVINGSNSTYSRRSSHDRVFSSSRDHISNTGGVGRCSSCASGGVPGKEREDVLAQQTTQQNILSARKDSTVNMSSIDFSLSVPPSSPTTSFNGSRNNDNTMTSTNNNLNPHHTVIRKNNHNNNPVFLLSKRLVYYCLVQTIARIGSSWYQLQYGFGDGAEYDASEASTLKTVLYLSEFVLNPSAGIGYLLVFLLIQPEAWKELKAMLGCSGACDPPKRSGKKEKGWRIKHHQKHHGGGQRRLKEGEGDNEKGKDMYVERCHEDASLLGSTCESNHSSSSYHKFSASSQDGDSDSRDSGHEDDFESLRNSSYTVSSNDSSMFPLLDNMTEDDLAREIERRYNPQYGGGAGLLYNSRDQKTPLLSSGGAWP